MDAFTQMSSLFNKAKSALSSNDSAQQSQGAMSANAQYLLQRKLMESVEKNKVGKNGYSQKDMEQREKVNELIGTSTPSHNNQMSL